jgi:hypothetical protein
MPITSVDFDRISEANLQILVDNEVPEGMLLDYKRDIYGPTDADKKEFLKDASSFANTAGGDIIIGMPASGGLPTTVTGVSADLDAEQLRLESLLRNRIEPRIIGVRMLPVPLANGQRALVIRIPKSWNPPHAVLQGKSRLIFARNSAGVHEASVDEMRTMFTAGATALERAREFQRHRTREIHDGETPIALGGEGGRLVLHIIPFSAFGSESGIDPRRIQGQDLTPIWCSGYNMGFNVDGYFTTSGKGSRSGYVQVFRSGIVEACTGDVRSPHEGKLLLYAEEVENEIVTKLDQYMSALARAEVSPPMFVMVGGVRMDQTKVVGKPLATMEPGVLRKTDLVLPVIAIEGFGRLEDYRQALKPIFDALWNAAGYEGSRSYDSAGNWKRRT